MAALDITYTESVPYGATTKALIKVTGSCHADGVTTGDILGSTYFVPHIYGWNFTPRQNITGGAFNVVKSLDAATKCEKLTLTCTDSDHYDFSYIGELGGDQ